MSEANKAIARRLLDEAWNQGDFRVIDEVVDNNYVNHDTQAQGTVGPSGMKNLIQTYRSAFPDLNFEVKDILADGNKVIVRWESTGTQLGPLPQIPATGRQVNVTGIGIMHFDQSGKVIEDWANWDTIGMMQQLGVM